MGRARLTKISAVCSTIAAALLISPWLLPQNSSQEAKAEPAVTPTIYNPYPPGILPPDLNSEIRRYKESCAKLTSSKLKLSESGLPYRPLLWPVTRPYFKTPELPQ